MGIIRTLGKVTSSKVFEKVEDRFVIKQNQKQNQKENQEQTSNYCNYIKANLIRIRKTITDLEIETKTLIDQVSSMETMKLSFKEKSELRKNKERANKNLKYLYLTRDCFTALAKNASGVILKNEELLLVIKFTPFFDGVPVLDIDDDEEGDTSLLGAFREVGQEFKEAFVSSKKSEKHIDFNRYLYRYSEKIKEQSMPDVASAIENFTNAMASQEVQDTTVSETSVETTALQSASDEIECSNCRIMLKANTKFCPECGTKIVVKKSFFCTECGEPVNPSKKFCANCGAKID